MSGSFHVDYSEPSNNYWTPSEKGCTAPRYVQQLRNGDYESLQWMKNKTIILFGDSIERDHVSLFCSSIMGREVEIIKGNHKLAVTSGGGAGNHIISFFFLLFLLLRLMFRIFCREKTNQR